ncbi:DUF1751-domain-containing protein [Thelephora terrestris]|uniref:DUF1751-domain-containing protein n=1 Tax=Thelephora terrestris TaxID=56493 RepID=A0A9P6L8K3_9AGAM|nr:DUF1751-domain-containing protein [Thelephora terrestris]
MSILSSPVQYVASTPPVTRAFTAATVVLSLLYYWVSWSSDDPYTAPYLILVPGTSIFYPWSFLTAGLVETSLIELVLTILVIPHSLRYFERLWGAVETIKFIVVTIVASNIIAFGLSWIEYFVFQNPSFAFGIQYHGQMALQAGILVAFTQAIPEHQIQVFGVFKARVKSLPMAYNTFSVIMSIIGYQSPYLLIQFGWLASYVWLRFYRKNSGDSLGSSTVYGDRSETFAFIMWFPPFVQGPVSVLADTLHSLATRFHLIPSMGHDIEGGYTQVPGGARAEAERRRAMALKALDQRMAGAPSSSTNGPTTSSNAGRQHQDPPHGRANSPMDPKPSDNGKDPAR